MTLGTCYGEPKRIWGESRNLKSGDWLITCDRPYRTRFWGREWLLGVVRVGSIDTPIGATHRCLPSLDQVSKPPNVLTSGTNCACVQGIHSLPGEIPPAATVDLRSSTKDYPHVSYPPNFLECCDGIHHAEVRCSIGTGRNESIGNSRYQNQNQNAVLRLFGFYKAAK